MKTPRSVSVAAVLALSLGVAACSGDDDKSDKAKDSSEETSAPAGVDPSRVSPTDLPEVPEVKRSKGAIADASFGDCAVEAGEQQVAGSVTNGTKAATDYVVTVSWVNETSDVLARGVATLEDLGAGEAKEFEVSAEVPDGVSTCTFHVVRGNLS